MMLFNFLLTNDLQKHAGKVSFFSLRHSTENAKFIIKTGKNGFNCKNNFNRKIHKTIPC